MLKSPSTFSFTVVLMRVMMFWLLMVASTRYFPSTVMPTTCTFSGETTLPSRPFSSCSQRHSARGFAPGIRAAFRKPCGVSQMSSW